MICFLTARLYSQCPTTRTKVSPVSLSHSLPHFPYLGTKFPLIPPPERGLPFLPFPPPLSVICCIYSFSKLKRFSSLFSALPSVTLVSKKQWYYFPCLNTLLESPTASTKLKPNSSTLQSTFPDPTLVSLSDTILHVCALATPNYLQLPDHSILFPAWNVLSHLGTQGVSCRTPTHLLASSGEHSAVKLFPIHPTQALTMSLPPTLITVTMHLTAVVCNHLFACVFPTDWTAVKRQKPSLSYSSLYPHAWHEYVVNNKPEEREYEWTNESSTFTCLTNPTNFVFRILIPTTSALIQVPVASQLSSNCL